MMRQPGMKPAVARWNSPGSSLRCDRSPVAPTRTKTCALTRADAKRYAAHAVVLCE